VLLVALASSLLTVGAIPKVTRRGRYLYTDSGRFYIKGIAYQEQGVVLNDPNNDFGEPATFTDPLSLPKACERDLPYLKELGVNALRVYSVDSSLNHDECMKLFSDAGIYTIIDLSLPLNGSIDRLIPSWSTNVLNQYTKTIDTFSKYDNVLAYNIGNEVVISSTIDATPFVKAAARDIKSYIKSKKLDALIGYAAINGAESFRNTLADYLSCDSNGAGSDSTSIDIYGLNDYSWCGESSFQASYSATTSSFANYNVVAHFSEFGCITSPPRLWTEAVALLGPQMSPVWSGGIAFSYFPATSVQGQFGMVTISSDGSSVTTSDDFDRLKTQYGLATPPNSPAQSSASDSTYPACPATSASFPASDKLPPTPNNVDCSCLYKTLSCQFTPQTSNYSAIVGELIGTACGLLSQQSGSCADIGADGETGVYGRVSGCDPTIKLSFVMSQFYEANNRNAASCSFSGNGTVNQNAPTSVSAANAAASSCVANPDSVFTPSSAPDSPQQTSNKPSGNNNSATSINMQAIYGLAVAMFIAVIGGVVTVL